MNSLKNYPIAVNTFKKCFGSFIGLDCAPKKSIHINLVAFYCSNGTGRRAPRDENAFIELFF